ncbi:unnamed protein product, partial [Scytosiphon promiscuus]
IVCSASARPREGRREAAETGGILVCENGVASDGAPCGPSAICEPSRRPLGDGDGSRSRGHRCLISYFGTVSANHLAPSWDFSHTSFILDTHQALAGRISSTQVFGVSCSKSEGRQWKAGFPLTFGSVSTVDRLRHRDLAISYGQPSPIHIIARGAALCLSLEEVLCRAWKKRGGHGVCCVDFRFFFFSSFFAVVSLLQSVALLSCPSDD